MREWINADARLPREDDADEYGCVLALHVYQGVMICGWRYIADNRFIRWWMRTPENPDDFAEIKKKIDKETGIW